MAHVYENRSVVVNQKNEESAFVNILTITTLI